MQLRKHNSYLCKTVAPVCYVCIADRCSPILLLLLHTKGIVLATISVSFFFVAYSSCSNGDCAQDELY